MKQDRNPVLHNSDFNIEKYKLYQSLTEKNNNLKISKYSTLNFLQKKKIVRKLILNFLVF